MKQLPSFPKKTLLAGFLLLLLLGPVFCYRAATKDDVRFAVFLDTIFEDAMRADTLGMHYTVANPEAFGIDDYTPILPDYPLPDKEAARAFATEALSVLDCINPSRLQEPNRSLYHEFRQSLQQSLSLADYVYYRMPLSPASGAPSQLPILLAEYAFRTQEDVEDYLGLLDQVDTYFSSLLAHEYARKNAGYLMPQSFLRESRLQCDTIVTKEALESGSHFLQTTFRERLNALLLSGQIDEAGARRYLMQNNDLLQNVVLPAYIFLGDGLLLLEDDTIPLAGLGADEEGRTYYKLLLARESGSARSPEEVQTLLRRQWDIEEDAIRNLAKLYPEAAARYATQEIAFPSLSPEEMLSDLLERMESDFPALSADICTVTLKEVNESLEPYTAPAFYLTPPIDSYDTNVIYVNREKTPDGLDLYTTLAHEGYPGHLYQTVFHHLDAAESGEHPAGTLLYYGGYLEGWATYAEFLSFDYARDLLAECNLDNDAVCTALEKHNRSLQLCLFSLLDLKIHYENASLDTVVDLLKDYGISDPDTAESVYLYILEAPCNYLKYYLGYLEILSLKNHAQQLWGASYSDLSFHTFLLQNGPLDFPMLQSRLETYTP
jgi:uncharacterized protein (DUF885 family)